MDTELFQFLAILNKTAVNILIWSCFGRHMFSVLLGKYVGVEYHWVLG